MQSTIVCKARHKRPGCAHTNDATRQMDQAPDSQMFDRLFGTDHTAEDQTLLNDFSIDALEFNLDLDLNGPTDQERNALNSLSPRNTSNPQTSDGSTGGHGQQHGSALVDLPTSSAGAGPLPTGYGIQLPSNTGSTLTEFTKRRNWSQRIVEEIRDFLHILSPDGRILYVSPSAQNLTAYDPTELVGRFIVSFVHPDDTGMFVREFNESIASGNPLRFFYRFKKADDTYAIFEAHGHPHIGSEAPYGAQNGQNGTSYCRGFFMMARPYPTRNAALLDSFLEHKMENERLKKRIADLKREEREDADGQSRTSIMSPSTAAVDQRSSPEEQHPSRHGGMPPPPKPGTANAPLTQRNLNEATSSARSDTMNDKMARYEGASHLDSIELFTGLRPGERSKGISTGVASPSLIKGDAGVAVLVDKDGNPTSSNRYPDSPYGDDKKKRLKVADEYVCTDCGTLDSPEWRKGPGGPKTLCNACGLRWAKKEKRKSISRPRNGGAGDGSTSHLNTGSNGGGNGGSGGGGGEGGAPTAPQGEQSSL